MTDGEKQNPDAGSDNPDGNGGPPVDHAELHKRLETLEDENADVSREISASEDGRRRANRDRSYISWAVIALYVISVVAILIFLGANYPALECDEAGKCTDAIEAWKDLSGVLLNIVSVVILPVVTLVLGFYFGSQKSKQDE